MGYRYYATAGVPVLFPFGYGLSYTSYAYTNLGLSTDKLAAGQALTASVSLRNTGGRDGEEIVQLYLKHKGSARFQPAHTLVGFARVALAAGEEKTVEVEVPYQRLGFYDAPSHGMVVETGEYELWAGPSSETLPLAASFTAQGVDLPPDETWSAESPYGNPSRDGFTDEAFAKLYQKPFESDEPIKKGEYTTMTALGQARKSATGRFLCWAGFQFTRLGIHFSADREANMKAARAGVDDLPFKNLVSNTWGIITPKAAKALLDMCNGKGGFGRLISGLIGKCEHRS